MNVVHVPFCFHPDPIGGTEVYVAGLARELERQGIRSIIAAPGEGDAAYDHDGLPVRRFAVGQTPADLRELYGAGDAAAAASFGRILDEEAPDLVHLHAFTRGASLRLVREAKRRRLPVVFTYHTPTASCQRGTLLRWGRDVCDGALRVHRCASCTLHGLGMNRASSMAAGSLSPALGRLAGAAGLSGGAWTALRMPELVQLRQASFRALMDEVDQVVVLCDWTRALLLRNGVPQSKLTLSRHGLDRRLLDGPQNLLPSSEQRPLRIAFLGRLDPTKGPDLLIRAVRALPGALVELHLYGIAQGEAGTAYLRQLQALACGDPRIAFLPPVAGDRVIALLRGYHLLAVPSQWLETGPLVVLEAFAAGIPVIGSDLGGIAELVRHEVNGLLVEPASREAWKEAIGLLADDRHMLVRLRQSVCSPRMMDQVGEDMITLYRTILHTYTALSEPALLG
jgi:glycosyltransferase involved in cell wall biosynthesis